VQPLTSSQTSQVGKGLSEGHQGSLDKAVGL